MSYEPMDSWRAASLSSALLVCLWLFLSTTPIPGQSGRNVTPGRRTTVLNIVAQRVGDPAGPPRLLASAAHQDQEFFLTSDQFELYDGGVRQKIESLVYDPSPARIIVLMDNSATLQTDLNKLAAVPAAFAPEIYEGDKVMVIGYDEKPEIITDFTDDPAVLQGTLSLLRKTDNPRLFDALNVVLEDVLRPEVAYSKRVIVLVADGLDRGSRIGFDAILGKLQNENITVYAIQVRDRTRGALRWDVPKPAKVLEDLTVGTGGALYSIDGDIKQAVKEICDELRNNRFQLTYSPEGVNPLNKRRILLATPDATLKLRYKAFHPPTPQ
jgi:VWFA-related protein